MTITVSPLSANDLDELVKIEEVSFPTPWSREAYESELNDNLLSIYLAAHQGERLIGYAGIWIIVDEGHITNVAVHPAYRQQGVGRLLMSHLAVAASARGVTSITLEVRPSNRPALTLYRSLGFIPHGLRPGYYTDTNEDALIMWRYLPTPDILAQSR